MSIESFNSELFEFLKFSTTPFHAVQYLKNLLDAAGFQKLRETEEWHISAGTSYYCMRDSGSIIVFRTGENFKKGESWRIAAAHTDSPALQIKPVPEMESSGYTQLGVEVYGSPILSTWFDRDLGISGRVILLDGKDQILSRTIDFKIPLAVIPNLAIHLNREVNKDYTIQRQKQLIPILCQVGQKESSTFNSMILNQLKKEYPGIDIEDVVGFDLFCYDTQPPSYTGLHGEFISAGRLDNLVSCFAGTRSLLQKDVHGNCMLICTNHEEVGSASYSGAQGNFISAVIERLEPEAGKRARLLGSSFLISMDNAHGVHPNFQEKHDPQHHPLLNHGPVIKYNSNQRYASTSGSAAIFKVLCAEACVPVQEFVMNNDLTCGSTIGPIAATGLGIQTVDVGVPSLAMHSIRETTGAKDPYLLYKAVSRLFSRNTLPKIVS